jgi:hypothetical protein
MGFWSKVVLCADNPLAIWVLVHNRKRMSKLVWKEEADRTRKLVVI